MKEYLRFLRGVYISNPKNFTVGILYPIGLIVLCLLAEYFENKYAI